jgi:hypothetical protein
MNVGALNKRPAVPFCEFAGSMANSWYFTAWAIDNRPYNLLRSEEQGSLM